MAKEFITKWIAEPLDNYIFAWRQVLDKIGILEPLDNMVYRYIEKPLVYAITRQLYDFKVFNGEVIPKEGAALFAFNHTSLLDPIFAGLAIIHSSGRIPYQLAKADLIADPYLHNFTRLNKAIYIRRGDSDELALEKCKEVLNEGEALVVFPEGTLSEGNGKMLPFKTGIVRIAYETGNPIIPAAIYGSDRIFGKKMKVPSTKGKLRIKFGEPIPLDKLFRKNRETPDFQKAVKKVQREVNKLWLDLWTMDRNEEQEKMAREKQEARASETQAV